MHVRVLGRIEAHVDGPKSLGGPTQRRLFGALVARRGEVVSVPELVEICWPGDDQPDRAEHNVRTYVHRLRAALDAEGDRIETVGSGYRLVLERGELDQERFEDLIASAERLADTGDLSKALDRIQEAQDLWAGRPYGQFADDPWAMAEVARLTELHWAANERLAETLLRVGQPANAIARLESMIRDQPLRERPRSLLMRALYESGRKTEALRAFQEFRQVLVDDIGVDPSPDLVELDRAIATGSLAPSTQTTRSVGGYELRERIGEGAFAVVHRATQESLGRDVAVKVVRAELANRAEFIRRFEAEAQMVSAIEHPNVVPLYDFWREPGQAFLVMRWMAGGSLERRLDRGPLELGETVMLVDQVAAALTASHHLGVIHRDVKPANILFDESGRAYLSDFGIALVAEERADIVEAQLPLLPVFAAPEQFRREPVGPEADVYALAIVAWNALTGQIPFPDTASRPDAPRRGPDGAIPAMALPSGLPPELEEVLQTATSALPAERYPTAAGFAVAFRSAALDDGVSQAPSIKGGERVNPYLGLRAFSETDAAAFHGRSRLVAELVEHLAVPGRNLLAVVGPSGSGKSSVVRAGLLPALRRGGAPGSQKWFTTTMQPGEHPFEALETALLRVAVNPPASLLEQLRDGDRGILRCATRILPDDDGVLLVVIDQFEELFTTGVPDADVDLFLRGLAIAAGEPKSLVRFVLTLRADFYDEPLRHSTFAPLIKAHTHAITPLAPDELEEAITLPAAGVGVGFESGLVAEIIADATRQPGALPLLQFALTQAFDHADGTTISIDDYRSIGGLAGALGQQAESLFQEIDSDEQAACRTLFGRLVSLGEGAEDTRRRLRRSELPAEDAIDATIKCFGDARLLTFDRDSSTREPTIEIAHEALLREWPRLRRWLDDGRDILRLHRRLTASSGEWLERNRDPSELYRGAGLVSAESLLTSGSVSLNSTEREFLEASIAARRDGEVAERRRVTRLRRLVAVTAVVAVLALVAGGLAFVQKRRADDQASLAAESEMAALANAEQAKRNAELADQRAVEAETAESRADLERMRAVSVSSATERTRLAALLAVEAYRLDPSVESLDVLHRVLTAVPGLRASVFSNERYHDSALFSGGTTLVAASRVALDVWDLQTLTLLRSAPLPEGSDNIDIVITVDGTVAAVRTHPDRISLFDASTGTLLSEMRVGSQVNGMALSKTGAQLVFAVDGGMVEIWNVGDDEPAVVIETDFVEAASVHWNPANDRLAVISGESIVQYWNPVGPELLWTSVPEGDLLTVTHAPVGALFTSDGQRLAVDSGFLSGRIRLIDTSDGSLPFPSTARTGEVGGHGGLFWHNEEELIIAAPALQSVPLYDLTTGEELGTLVEGMSAEDSVYSPELDLLVASGLGGFQLWSVDGSGPLERVVPYSDEQRSALENNGGTVHVALAADGSRVIVSLLTLPDRPATTSFNLTEDRNRPASFPYEGSLAYSYGPNTMHFDFTGFQLLDADDQPYGEKIPLTLDMTDNAASADGRFVAIGRAGGFVDLYTGAGEPVANLKMELGAGDGSLVIPSLSADGRAVAAFTDQGTTAVWSTETLEQLDVDAPGQGRLIGDWLWTFDGHSVKRYDPWSNEQVGVPLVGQLSGVFYPALDEANDRFAIMGADLVSVYDMETGTQIGRELPYRPLRIVYSADGSGLAVASDDRVTIWNYDTDTWAGLACRLAGRNLTDEEWEQLGPRTIGRRATCPEFPLGG